MLSTQEQVFTFLEKCEELKKCKFIMATTKIKDLLKCIVNSPEMYRLFDTVTKDYDYLSAKSKCLVRSGDGFSGKNYVVLPKTVGQRLAFIFCLLVEFDRDTLNFNDFLQIYFSEDGSYISSYRAFCNKIIDSFEEVIRQAFKNQLGLDEDEEGVRPIMEIYGSNSERARLITDISLAIEGEKQFIGRSSMPKEDKEGAYRMLSELLSAVRSGNEKLIDALICGYNYCALYNRCVSDGIAPLIQALSEYEDTL